MRLLISSLMLLLRFINVPRKKFLDDFEIIVAYCDTLAFSPNYFIGGRHNH